jgi:hypothetical protein
MRVMNDAQRLLGGDRLANAGQQQHETRFAVPARLAG